MTKATIPSTVYYVYNASGTKQGTYSNPFKAIEYLAKNKLDGYSIKQSNDSQEIFKLNLNSKNTFYKFQFTNYYGSTTSAAAAKDWTMGYSYAHVVRCDGIFGSNTDVRTAGQPYSHSYNSLLRVPELWALEGNTGAYVYRKSISYNGYRSTESTVNLSQAKLKFAADTPYNAYVYMSSNSNSSKGAISCDLGLICASTYGGDWYLISNRVQSGSTSNPGMYRPYSTPLVKSTFTGGEYKPTANVKLKYAYKSGSVYMIAQNLSTNLTQNVEIFDSRFDTSSPNICLMTGTSLVPNVKDSSNQMVASDIKSGAYLKNVVWTGNLIYTGTAWNGTSSAFNGGSNNATNYVVTYDTDNATYSSSGANETININYDPTYKQ